MPETLTFLAHLVWALVVLWCVPQVCQTVLAFAPEFKDAPDLDEAFDIPEDLLALSMQENESWAQEELVRVMREKYETYKDWNRVRSAMGLGIRV